MNLPARQIPFWLMAIVFLALGWVSFWIVQPYIFPLLLAGTVAWLCRPYYLRIVPLFRGHYWIASAVMSTLVLVLGLLPLLVVLVMAGRELTAFGQQLAGSKIEDMPLVQRGLEWAAPYLENVSRGEIQESLRRGGEAIAALAVRSTGDVLLMLVNFSIGLLIGGLALFYFLVQGPELQQKFEELSPLEPAEERLLIAEFGRLSKGIILGTLFCALIQGVLTGLGLALAGIPNYWLLGAVAMVMGLVPYVGPAGIWAPAALWLIFQGHHGAASFLAIYGLAIVTPSDNLIRAYVLQDSANIHPLLALVAVLGGLELFGFWGLFVGPILLGLFLTLLKIVLHRRREQEREDAKLDFETLNDAAEANPRQVPKAVS